MAHTRGAIKNPQSINPAEFISNISTYPKEPLGSFT